jgi:hypothetical protein
VRLDLGTITRDSPAAKVASCDFLFLLVVRMVAARTKNPWTTTYRRHAATCHMLRAARRLASAGHKRERGSWWGCKTGNVRLGRLHPASMELPLVSE